MTLLALSAGGVAAGAAGDDAVATNGTADTQSVQGSDDRVRVDPTTAWPRRASGHVFMEFENGSTGFCSAATISEDVILTAAHCVYNATLDEWASERLVYRPARHNRSTAPYGAANWTHIVTYKNWTDSGDSDYDIAIVQLDRPIGDVVGYMGRVAAPADHPLYTGWLNINQYPGDKPYGTMWFDSNKTSTSVTNNGHHISHNVDTAAGSSGSSAYKYYSGSGTCPTWASCPGRYTAGVHTYAGNFANRLTPSKYEDVEYWMNNIVDKSLVDDAADLVDDGPQWTELEDTASPGGSVEVRHDVRNIGTARVSDSHTSGGSGTDFTVEYYLSTSGDGVDSGDTKVDTTTVSADITPFSYTVVNTAVDVPSATAAGDYYVCYEIDAGGDVSELATTNNEACTDEQVTVSTSSTTGSVRTDGATVYVGANDTSLHAVDAGTGNRSWTFTEPSERVLSSPTAVNGTVYVGSGIADSDGAGALYAVDAATGEEQWNFTAPERAFTSSPTIVNGTVYVGGIEANESKSFGEEEGELYAVDAETGAQQWEYAGIESLLVSSPNIANGTAYVGSWNASADGGNGTGTLHAVDTDTGQQEWLYTEPDSIILSSPTVHNGTVYLSADGVYAVDAATGTETWSFVDVSFISSSPTVANDTVFVGTGDDAVYAFEADTGSPTWSFFEPTGSVTSSPTYSNGTVFVGSDDTALYAIDASSGSQEWRFNESTARIRSSPTVYDGAVYVGSDDGHLYAVEAGTGGAVWNYSNIAATGESSPTVVADPSSGSSVGTRVELRTLGHHDGTVGDGGVVKSDLTYLEQIADSPWATPTTGTADPVGSPPFATFPGNATQGIAIDVDGNVRTFDLTGQELYDAAPGDPGSLETRDDIGSDDTDEAQATEGYVALGVPDYTNEDGVVDTDGLRISIDDWRTAETDTVTLRDVIDFWRSGEPIS